MQFERLAEFFDQLEQTTSRNLMVELLAQVFREATPAEVDKIVYLSQGRLAPAFVALEFGVGEALVREALAEASGCTSAAVQRRFKEIGDYGLLAQELLGEQPPSMISVEEVFATLYEVATAGGKGAVAQKKQRLVALLRRLGPRAAKHVARIVLGRLRLGIGDPTVMEGLSYARTGSKADRAALERAYN